MANKPRKIPTLKTGPSRVQTHHAYEADINQIMARHARNPFQPIGTGQPRREMVYMDMVGLPQDYATAHRMVTEGINAFARLPSNVRSRFLNSPLEALNFVANPANLAEARKLGLARPEEPGKAGDEPPAPPKASKAPKAPKVVQTDLADEAAE